MVTPEAAGDTNPSATDSSTTTKVGEETNTVVASTDGGLVLEIPNGALPDKTDADKITITTLGPDDAPDSLAGVEFRSAFYSLEPNGLEFTRPVTLTRCFNAADSGFDLSAGPPVVLLAVSSPEGTDWEFAADQVLTTDGDEIVVSGEIGHFSYAYAFGLKVVASSPAVVPVEAGDPTEFKIDIDDSELVGGAADIGSIEVEADGVSVSASGRRVNIACEELGVYPYTVTLTLVESVSNSAYALAEIFQIPLEPLVYTIVLTGEIHCEAADGAERPSGQNVAADVTVAALQVCTVHTSLGSFPSFLQWFITLSGDDAPDVGSLLVTGTNGMNAGDPVVAPVVGGDAELDAGIPRFGDYGIEELVASFNDGTTVDLTQVAQALIGCLGGVTVEAAESCVSSP